MDGITKELKRLQIREAKLLEQLTAMNIRRASIIEENARRDQKNDVTDKPHIQFQPDGKSHAMKKQEKGETTNAASNTPKLIKIRDIIRYSGCPGSTQPRNRGLHKHKTARRMGDGEVR